jgi:hypothetical protein
MNEHTTIRRPWAIAALVFLAAAIPLGIVWTVSSQAKRQTLEARAASVAPQSPEARRVATQIAQERRNVGFGWADVGAAVVGMGLLIFAATNRPKSPWGAVAAVAPIIYLVLSAAWMAVSRETVPVLRLAAASGAMAAYGGVVFPLSGRLKYGVCCACLGMLALFFGLWEPPLPKPIPIRKPLGTMEAVLLNALPGWTGHHKRLDEATEKSLGADEYLNLELKPPEGDYAVTIFVTYNANAMSKVPHVPWVCMVQSGFRKVSMRQDELTLERMPGREIKPNVLLFDPPEGMGRTRALIFHYFNVGGVYTWNREWTRVLATSGSLTGSYLSQTQIVVYFEPREGEDPTAKGSKPYQRGLEMLNLVAPLLEKEYYPSLNEAEGG